MNRFLLLVIGFLTISCTQEEEKIEVAYESYRYSLWNNLDKAGYSVDFVGTLTDPYNYPTSFDRDHEGVGGITSGQILLKISSVLDSVDTPNVVCLGVGVNDLLWTDVSIDSIVQNISQIVSLTQRVNPECVFLLEKIAFMDDNYSPGINSRIAMLNTNIAAFSENNNSVHVVDCYTDFTPNYLADFVHYNEEGAEFVAGQYFEVFDALGFNKSDVIKVLPLGDSKTEGYRIR